MLIYIFSDFDLSYQDYCEQLNFMDKFILTLNNASHSLHNLLKRNTQLQADSRVCYH